MKRLSVLIPCCNEEENVDRFQAELLNPLLPLADNVEFIFIDDGSTDQTLPLLHRLKEKNLALSILSHGRNLGLGAALQTGLRVAQGEAVLTLDADLTFHPTQAPALLAAYTDGVDCVMGSPALGRMEGVPFIRKVMSDGVNFIYRLLLGHRLTAVSSIFRLYRSSAVQNLPLESQAFNINAEILLRLLKDGRKIVEVPAVLTTRKGGTSKMKTGREVINHFRIFMEIARWRRSLSVALPERGGSGGSDTDASSQ